MKMLLFFYTIYGAAHFYTFLKIKSVFPLNSTTSILLAFILIFMTFSPLFIHLYLLRRPDIAGRVYAYIGYLWIAFLLLFISISIPVDMYNLFVRLTSLLVKKNLTGIMLSPLFSFFIPVFLSVALCIYGYFEANSLRTERLTIETSKLPKEIDKLIIAHISDLHLGIIVREEKLKKVLKAIEAAKPDLIVSTGDLLDGEVNHIDYLADKLRGVHAKLGKFAVTGNHEFYAGITHSLKFLQEAGFTTLRGERITIQNLINIAGVDDPTGKNKKHSGTNLSEREILSKLPSDIFTLLLKHRSDIDNKSLGLFDLQLSGHTHKGQIFPINLATKFLFHHHSGRINLPKSSALYVNRGAGTAGPPIRLFAPPEITIIEVVLSKK